MNGLDLLMDQEYILEQLFTYIDKEDIDLVVVAGDIFDRANPSQAALKLANDALVKINIELGKKLIIISGNHDSRERINMVVNGLNQQTSILIPISIKFMNRCRLTTLIF